MFGSLKRRASAGAACTILLFTAGFVGTAHAGKALDGGLFTTYDPTDGTSVNFTVCGSVGDTSGCYGGEHLSPPFEKACAVLEGAPTTEANIMTRDIYVLDKRVSGTDPALLYVYTRTDTFSQNGDSISASLKKKVTLDFTGGSAAKCTLAGDDKLIFAGVVGGTTFDKIDKKRLRATPGGGEPLLSFTADDRGYIAVNFQGGGFGVSDPKGNGLMSGGGNEYLAGTRNGLTF